MKKLVLLFALFCIGVIPVFGTDQQDQKMPESIQKEEVRNKFSYLRFDYGTPGLFGLNFGKRGQLNHNGFDVSVGSFFWEPRVASVNMDINYLFFLKPNYEKQWYLGLGLKNAFLVINRYWYYNIPLFTVGREYLNKKRKRFLELKIGYYGLYKTIQSYRRSYLSSGEESGVIKHPFVYICHGIEF